jgi:protein-S-isoprenylcysteine O-methyltransferase Ste14
LIPDFRLEIFLLDPPNASRDLAGLGPHRLAPALGGEAMDDADDNPGVVAPPPLIALATLLLGLALNWLLPSFILRGILWFSTRLIIGAILIGAGAALAIFAIRDFGRAGTNVEPWKPTVTLVTEFMV